MISPREEQRPADVASHYDDLDQWYREIWGEHVHHGLWLDGRESVEQATLQLIERLAARVEIRPGDRVCDAGCGYGGTARVLAREYGAHVVGITLSEAQWRYTQERAGDETNPRFVLGDFYENKFEGESFDVAISIESSEHMPDKPAFFNEMYRILRPGGRIAVYAWLAKERPAPWEVNYLLEPICREGRLSGMGTQPEYSELLGCAGFEQITFEDYSSRVKRTWPIIVWRMIKRLSYDAEAWRYLFAGSHNRVFAKTILRIWTAYETGSMRYGLFTARKPGGDVEATYEAESEIPAMA